jgi:NAD(P)-dependent dehydrogenase (short-subunit alcohol dehydrogenase family)
MSNDQRPARLAGRRALVTGAASGIGLATVRRLVADGARVVMTDARLEPLMQAAESVGGGVTPVVCDVGDEASVVAAVASAVETLGGLDTLITCAGITRVAETHRCSLEEWDTVIRVNLTGTFLPVKHVLPALIAAGGGAIVTVGSVASVVAAGRTSSYDAAKGGVLQFTRAVAVEYADEGIRANCVLPGLVATGLAANSNQLHGAMERPTKMGPSERLKVPMARAADPSELAGVITFLVSDDSSFMTGAAVTADGGYTAI